MIDVDSSYDPKSGISLDEHRQIEFAKIKEVPFGKPVQAVAQTPPRPETIADPDPEETE